MVEAPCDVLTFVVIGEPLATIVLAMEKAILNCHACALPMDATTRKKNGVGGLVWKIARWAKLCGG